jgi:hypothetical protein
MPPSRREPFRDEALELLRQMVLVAEGLDFGDGPGELVDAFNQARKHGVGLLDLARALVIEAGYDLPP